MKIFFLLSILSFFSCTSHGQAEKSSHKSATTASKQASYSNKLAQRFFSPLAQDLESVNRLYDSLTMEQKAAQMLMIASSDALGFPFATHVKDNFNNGFAQNVIFLKGTLKSFQSQEQYLSRGAQNPLLPLYACDCEPSLLHYKFTDQPRMTTTNKLKDSMMVMASLDSIHRLMNKLNIDINFAPVVDLGNNKAIINNRAFSTQKDTMLRLAKNFIDYAQNNGIATTVKHFPGHGAVVGDTHKGKVWIDGKMTEVPNFTSIIKSASPIFVMVGHIAIRNNAEGYNTPNGNPATISRNIVTGLLKDKIAFKGIAVTDAMNMGAIKNVPNADFEAVKAGIDLVLMPNNPAKLHGQIVAALKQGDALSKQIEQSIKKIILLKVITDRIAQP